MGDFFNRRGGRLILTDLEVDPKDSTVSVDHTNNRLGLGTKTPQTRLTVEGTVTLKEQADADSDTAGYGQIWVNTATPNELYFTTDAGNDIQLTSGSAAAGASLSGTTDNTICTVTGANAIQGEANLLFDGSTLAVTGALTTTTTAAIGTNTTLGTAGNTTGVTVTTITNTGTNVGKALTVAAGSSTTGSNNLNGGDLLLKSGNGDGSGISSIEFYSKKTNVDATAKGMTLSGGDAARLTVGSGAAEDTMIAFDGNAQDFRIGIDDGTDQLEIGQGAAHGANTALTVNASGQVTTFNIPAAAVAQASDHIIFLDGGATGAPKAESIDDFLTAIAGSGISVSSSQLTASGGGAAANDLDHILHQQVFS